MISNHDYNINVVVALQKNYNTTYSWLNNLFLLPETKIKATHKIPHSLDGLI